MSVVGVIFHICFVFFLWAFCVISPLHLYAERALPPVFVAFFRSTIFLTFVPVCSYVLVV